MHPTGLTAAELWPTLLAARVRRAVRRDGLPATVRRAAGLAVSRVRLHERHVWYELDLGEARPRCELPDGVSVGVARPDEFAMLDRLQSTSVGAARTWRAEGGELWLARSDDAPVFSCWIFHRRAPLLAARGGWLDLPDGAVLQEGSYTDPAWRGRGIAPAVWCAIADELQKRGVRRIIRKAEERNAAANRAGVKVGFRPMATMDVRRRGPSTRVVVEASSATGSLLAQRLER